MRRAGTPPARQALGAGASGLESRRLAVEVLHDVIGRRLALDERLERLTSESAYQALSVADRGLVRAICLTALRRLGTVRSALSGRLASGLPPRAGQLEPILIAAVAQILFLDVADHGAVDTAVKLVREDGLARHYAPLANAVLRRIAREKEAVLAAADPLETDTPPFFAARWIRAYGRPLATAIAARHREEPALDLSLAPGADPADWAARLGAVALPTGSLRLAGRRLVTELPGFAEGRWWVQDAAAALPARLLNVLPGERVLDLCAAPGGKTAQLAAAGAQVVAIDRSAARLERLRANMARLDLHPESLVADATTFEAPPFDAVLLDAPCSATGTVRRHPDVLWTRTAEDLLRLADLQRRLLRHAATLVRPGGRLVYATCSLEPEEGEWQIASFLADHGAFRRIPVTAVEIGGLDQCLNADGDLRTLPAHLPDQGDRIGGLDGFFAARLGRLS